VGFFRPDVVLVTGHFDGQQYVKWPHLCPVKSCAIARFLVRKRRRNVVELGANRAVISSADSANSREQARKDVCPQPANPILPDLPLQNLTSSPDSR